MICYRGARASDEEIKFYQLNNGKIIMNLGFLSTSRSKKSAEKFADNLLFIIRVKNNKRDEDLDFGYAGI